MDDYDILGEPNIIQVGDLVIDRLTGRLLWVLGLSKTHPNTVKLKDGLGDEQARSIRDVKKVSTFGGIWYVLKRDRNCWLMRSLEGERGKENILKIVIALLAALLLITTGGVSSVLELVSYLFSLA